MLDWLKGWYETLVIRFTQPELYAQLCNKGEFDEDDFIEAERPE
jgi:hypothetical protein